MNFSPQQGTTGGSDIGNVPRESISIFADTQTLHSHYQSHYEGSIQLRKASRKKDSASSDEIESRAPKKRVNLDALRRAINSAISASQSLLSLCSSGDLILKSNAGFQLIGCLDDLWKMRTARESEWGDLLNLVQGAVAKVDFELLKPSQCGVINKVVQDYLGSGLVETDDIAICIDILTKSELDPYAPISLPFSLISE